MIFGRLTRECNICLLKAILQPWYYPFRIPARAFKLSARSRILKKPCAHSPFKEVVAMNSNEYEVLVSSDGYEGRIVNWVDNRWQAFDFANFRHWFSSPQTLSNKDLHALRLKFNIQSSQISDTELVSTPPSKLRELQAAGR